jgi:hypothetical protein
MESHRNPLTLAPFLHTNCVALIIELLLSEIEASDCSSGLRIVLSAVLRN